jgi:beta-xylosidase
MYAFAIPNDSRGAQQIDYFCSSDLLHWQSATALRALPGEELFNESVCRAGDRFVMAFESRDAHYPPFTIYFAESHDLKTWTRIPGAVYGTDRYTACPTIRYLDGFYYLLYLEQFEPWRFETYLTRSPDLVQWEQSAKNPVLDPEGVEETNASDMDLVEFQRKVRAYYLYGDQRGRFGTTWAEFNGTLQQFFQHYF